ncbi:hypothetical protein WMY93_025116 [Mugilogobius chulae]|uniref:Protein kinase domain-containing protein n=1 Tax=Mugilogobius chulae TaxID=88201 RepID=A0AAW0N1M5_9GOBI
MTTNEEDKIICVLRQLMDKGMDRRNIVKFHDTFDTRLGKAMVLELLDMSLLRYYNTHRPLPLEDIRSITKEVAVALQALKDMSIIHADLKLDNVMVVDQSQRPLKIKLIDFGLSMYSSEAKAGMRIQHVWRR